MSLQHTKKNENQPHPHRVRSHRGTQFRKWATERLNEYLVKGFTMDDERLKSVSNIGSDYFDEMLELRGR